MVMVVMVRETTGIECHTRMIQFKHAEQQSQRLYTNTKRPSSVGFNSDVDGHILTNNVPSTHRHLISAHPLSRRQCHATRRDRTQEPLNLLCKVHNMHPQALTSTLALNHNTFPLLIEDTEKCEPHNCKKRHPLTLPTRLNDTKTRSTRPHDLLFTYREHLD